ncbi:uncharacterized protein JCM6883_000402 [Sporobolomyces salmoneus]|uniref:uncharacterized protein n=1 Tax=Sporobolomyces salmoneus TaxID=183962 RepID=UPI0031759709
MNKGFEFPSIYTSLPIPPPVTSQYDPSNAHVGERESTLRLSQLVQQGPVDYILRQALNEQKGKELLAMRKQGWRTRQQGGEASDSEGGSSKRGRKRSARGWSSTGAEGGDDEKTDRESGVPRKKTGKHKKSKGDLPRLVREAPRIDVPSNFPSASLLSSLHLQASQLFASTNSLLPPLTMDTPLLPSHLLAHFNQLSAALNKQEEEILVQPGLSNGQWNRAKENRIQARGAGERRGVWNNVEKKFDSTALVALGMLTKLLVEDAIQPPRIEISQHSPPTPFEVDVPSSLQVGADGSSAGLEQNGEAAGEEEPDLDFSLPIPPAHFSSSSTAVAAGPVASSSSS